LGKNREITDREKAEIDRVNEAARSSVEIWQEFHRTLVELMRIDLGTSPLSIKNE
jgi:hypothetical protein